MDKFPKTVEVVARETLTVGGENKKPGTVLIFPVDEAKRLVEANAAAWPEDVSEAASKRPAGRDLIAAIGQAMRAIDPAEGVTPEGKASLYALRHHLGFEITAEERDAAHQEFASKRDLFTHAEKHDFGDPLLNAIRDLDRKAVGNWTQDGKPSATVLSEVLQRTVSANERDEAWAAFQKKLAELAEKK